MPAFACGLCHHLCGSDRFDVGMKSVLWAGSVSLGWAQLMWKQQIRGKLTLRATSNSKVRGARRFPCETRVEEVSPE